MAPIMFTAVEPCTKRELTGVVKRLNTKQRDVRWVYGALEGITDENDRLFFLTSPRWINVEYFQIRLLKTILWQDGPRVKLPESIETPVFEREIPASRSGTELFCGSGHLSDAFQREGFAMKRYDRKLTSSPGRCYNADWSIVSSDIVKELFEVTVLHMSPDCSTYSQLAGSYHGRKLLNDFLGTSVDAHLANGHAVKLFNALRARMLVPRSPFIWTAENPEASFHHTPVVREMCLPVEDGGCDGAIVRLSFCAFGERVRKNTVFVTNSRTLIALAGDDRFYCTNKRCTFHKNMAHESVTVRNKLNKRGKIVASGQSTDRVTAFPVLLSEFVAKCVDVDVANARNDRVACDNAKCTFNNWHRGLCSHMMVTASK